MNFLECNKNCQYVINARTKEKQSEKNRKYWDLQIVVEHLWNKKSLVINCDWSPHSNT